MIPRHLLTLLTLIFLYSGEIGSEVASRVKKVTRSLQGFVVDKVVLEEFDSGRKW
jgi:hypothetical protein